ncbi:class I SAM-dependent methyltransferase [Flavicella sp.]|uniref:O-methyltransferase n=1 Tax=Flavicella sp. TaxID=2957742 RepID=UPI002616F832|nr:class I SAM-dependent methyltransferase [Flavicella sp.]MDG1804431.1 class I SAM-dependent methyltransferase [Flavicella sp.]MDG2280586.1 class I SAM-dependent methyltransferase [Flavicella sp.]
MTQTEEHTLAAVINALYQDAKYDKLKMLKGAAKSLFRSFKPENFEDAYLAISKDQGEALVHLIQDKKLKNIVEFGTSFGISTLYLAQGVAKFGGYITTTELLESKAKKAINNFKKAGVESLIDIKVGDALVTLKNYSNSIDLLVLDGWMDLYLPLFKLLEPNFYSNTHIYVDNANMTDSQKFLSSIATDTYKIQSKFNGKVAIITVN